MKVIDLTPEHEAPYFECPEDWSDEIKEAGDHKACWYRKYANRGLLVKLALDDSGKVGGMIQYLPIEESYVQGNNLFFILCLWVHGHKKADRDGIALLVWKAFKEPEGQVLSSETTWSSRQSIPQIMIHSQSGGLWMAYSSTGKG